MWAALSGGKTPPHYLDYLIMREMGWTYEELMSTPAAVVNNVIRCMGTEAKYRKEHSGG